MRHTRRRDTGFTLLELLVSISTIGILAMLSLLSFNTYRDRAFRARAQDALHAMQVALEAGRVDRDTSNAMLWTWTMDPGPVTAGDGPRLLPGFVNSRHLQISAWFSGPCDAGALGAGCVIESATVSVCRTGYTATVMHFRDAPSVSWDWQGFPWC